MSDDEMISSRIRILTVNDIYTTHPAPLSTQSIRDTCGITVNIPDGVTELSISRNDLPSLSSSPSSHNQPALPPQTIPAGGLSILPTVYSTLSNRTSALSPSTVTSNDITPTNTLCLLNGDILGGCQLASHFKGESMVDILNEINPSLVCIGNHEFDYGTAQLEKCINMSHFPWLAENIALKSQLISNSNVINKNDTTNTTTTTNDNTNTTDPFYSPLDNIPSALIYDFLIDLDGVVRARYRNMSLESVFSYMLRGRADINDYSSILEHVKDIDTQTIDMLRIETQREYLLIRVGIFSLCTSATPYLAFPSPNTVFNKAEYYALICALFLKEVGCHQVMLSSHLSIHNDLEIARLCSQYTNTVRQRLLAARDKIIDKVATTINIDTDTKPSSSTSSSCSSSSCLSSSSSSSPVSSIPCDLPNDVYDALFDRNHDSILPPDEWLNNRTSLIDCIFGGHEHTPMVLQYTQEDSSSAGGDDNDADNPQTAANSGSTYDNDATHHETAPPPLGQAASLVSTNPSENTKIIHHKRRGGGKETGTIEPATPSSLATGAMTSSSLIPPGLSRLKSFEATSETSIIQHNIPYNAQDGPLVVKVGMNAQYTGVVDFLIRIPRCQNNKDMFRIYQEFLSYDLAFYRKVIGELILDVAEHDYPRLAKHLNPLLQTPTYTQLLRPFVYNTDITSSGPEAIRTPAQILATAECSGLSGGDDSKLQLPHKLFLESQYTGHKMTSYYSTLCSQHGVIPTPVPNQADLAIGPESYLKHRIAQSISRGTLLHDDIDIDGTNDDDDDDSNVEPCTYCGTPPTRSTQVSPEPSAPSSPVPAQSTSSSQQQPFIPTPPCIQCGSRIIQTINPLEIPTPAHPQPPSSYGGRPISQRLRQLIDRQGIEASHAAVWPRLAQRPNQAVIDAIYSKFSVYTPTLLYSRLSFYIVPNLSFPNLVSSHHPSGLSSPAISQTEAPSTAVSPSDDTLASIAAQYGRAFSTVVPHTRPTDLMSIHFSPCPRTSMVIDEWEKKLKKELSAGRDTEQVVCRLGGSLDTRSSRGRNEGGVTGPNMVADALTWLGEVAWAEILTEQRTLHFLRQQNPTASTADILEMAPNPHPKLWTSGLRRTLLTLPPLKSHVAIINGGFLRGDTRYDTGSVLNVGTFLAEFPFPKRVLGVIIKGSDLVRGVNQELQLQPSPTGAFPHFSDNMIVDYTAHPIKVDGNTIWAEHSPHHTSFNQSPLDLEMPSQAPSSSSSSLPLRPLRFSPDIVEEDYSQRCDSDPTNPFALGHVDPPVGPSPLDDADDTDNESLEEAEAGKCPNSVVHESPVTPHVLAITIDDQPIDLDAYYYLSTTQFIAWGGDNCSAFRRGHLVPHPAKHMRRMLIVDVVMSYLRQLREVEGIPPNKGDSFIYTPDRRCTAFKRD